MRRIVRAEILDGNEASAEDVRDSLVDLQRINRWFGGTQTTAKMIDEVLERTGAKQLSLLEVASASGDIPNAIQQELRGREISFDYTLLDRDASHFDGHRHAAMVRGDALALPFRDNSFDVVSCALFAHHLEPAELTVFAREALRVSRIAVLINDLRRSYLHLAAVHAGKPLFRWITRHDSVASVWRSYTVDEIGSLLRDVSGKVEIRRSYLFRMGAIAWK
jgi:ubiquinone/menaquinone biosynthesis C-methylase UbiE